MSKDVPVEKAAEMTDKLTNDLSAEGAKEIVRKGMTEQKMEELLSLYRQTAEDPKKADYPLNQARRKYMEKLWDLWPRSTGKK